MDELRKLGPLIDVEAIHEPQESRTEASLALASRLQNAMNCRDRQPLARAAHAPDVRGNTREGPPLQKRASGLWSRKTGERSADRLKS